MATVTFTGDVLASNGTSLQVLAGVTHFNGASFDGDIPGGGNRLRLISASNDGSGAAYQGSNLNVITTEDSHEIVTGLTASAGSTSGTSTIVTITGLRLDADFDNTNYFSAENLSEFQRAIGLALSGDDNFILSGAVSRIWGDFQTAPTLGTVHMGDDIFTLAGATAALIGSVTIYGDAQTVTAGAKVIAGNDIINAGPFQNAAVTFFGDFQSVAGKVTYGNDQLYGGSSADFLYGDRQISGTAGGNDLLVGNGGDDHLFGGGGNDALRGGTGADAMDGGAGVDSVDYRASSYTVATMIADLANPSQNTNDAAGDTYSSIEVLFGRDVSVSDDLRGNNVNNKIVGFAGDDILAGRGGKDQLFGGQGADTIDGGLGSDALTGGPGQDHFVFSTALNAKNNVDTIFGFKSVDDTIQIAHGIMTALPNIAESLPDTAFFASNTGEAHDRNDRILYEKDTGKLFYDADGNANGKAILFAILDNHPGITASDFEITL